MTPVLGVGRRVVSWAGRHPLITDAIIAFVLGAVTLFGFFAAEARGSQRDHDLFGVILIAGSTLGFSQRRRWPFVAFALVVICTIGFWISDYPQNIEIISLLAVYSVIVHGGERRRRVWAVAGTGIAALTLITIVGVLAEVDDVTFGVAAAVAVINLAAAAFGEVIYGRQRRLRLLEARAARAEAEREVLAREAVLAERSRIARDLHDVVAHSMSVMVVQASAAERMVASKPDRAIEALGQVQHTGREALAEMRRMLGVLRDGPADKLAPQPSTAAIPALVEQTTAAGVPTALRIDGDAPDRAGAAVEIAAYRIVQEALTNVIKHGGPGASASVVVSYSPAAIGLEIIDDGVGAQVADTVDGAGHGLVGMRERVELFSGTFRAGPRPGGGFRVAARIPLDPAPSPGTAPTAAAAHGPETAART